MATTHADLRGSKLYLAGAGLLVVIGLIAAALGSMYTAAILFTALVFFLLGVTRIMLAPKPRGGGKSGKAGWIAAGSASAGFAGTGDGGSGCGDGGSGGSCGGGGCGGGGGGC
ncbi:hypothetical protein [Nocardia sp. NPDC058705]|uniref:hypothetical protein n=1 Tax=Nocardia sp. NPDC058705 TaxID=3346609 RepID=UPI0036BEC8E7